MDMEKEALNVGNEHLDLVVMGEEEINLLIDHNTQASLYVRAEGNDASATLHIDVLEDANLTMLTWNDAENFKLNVHINVERGGKVKVVCGEMSEGEVGSELLIELKGEDSEALVKSAILTAHKKNFNFNITHHAPHTIGLMENYAVVKENGNYNMIAIGKIEKGAYASESHQTSRVLTMSDRQVSSVTPQLLIDENDVKASHANTIGQPDENQLYYLQTRGLNREQALGLIMISYLLPVADALDDEKIHDELCNKIETKAGLACLM